MFFKKKNPYYDKNKYHHKPHGFRNPPGSPRGRQLTAELAREAAHFMGELRRAVHDPYPFPEDHVIPEVQAKDAFLAMGARYKLIWLGHASFLIEFDGVRVLTDPYLSDYASPVPLKATKRLVPAAIREERLPRVDIIAISHNHYDHLDMVSIKRLARSHPEAQVVVPLGVGELLGGHFSQVRELDWFDQATIDGLDVICLPAVHTSKRGIGDTNRSLWCGFGFKDRVKNIYFAGDTAYGAVFQQIGARCGPFDLGLVPIGAYQPRILMRPVHVTPEEAIEIGRDIGARRLIGMHWGTIRLTTEPMLEPKERFLTPVEESIERQTLRIGETVGF